MIFWVLFHNMKYHTIHDNMIWLVMSWSGLVNPRAVECFLFPDLLKRQIFSISINYINPIKYGQPNMFQYEFHSHNTHKNLQSVDGLKKSWIEIQTSCLFRRLCFQSIAQKSQSIEVSRAKSRDRVYSLHSKH